MKKLTGFLFVLVMVFGISGISSAALWDRGGGLIYDDVQDITWLQDIVYGASSSYDDGDYVDDGLFTWDNAMQWVSGLEYAGFEEWRLPSRYGASGLGGELWYLYHAYQYGLPFNASWGKFSDGNGDPITFNLYPLSGPYNLLDRAWYRDEDGSDPTNSAWIFDFWEGSGNSETALKAPVIGYHAWAVHDGDVGAVPIPSAIWLLGSGLIGLVGFRRRFRKA